MASVLLLLTKTIKMVLNNWNKAEIKYKHHFEHQNVNKLNAKLNRNIKKFKY